MAELVVGNKRISSAELSERTARAVAGFTALKVAKGSRVALLLRNDAPFFEATFALQHLGAYAVPVNWHATGDEVSYILKDCGASALVAHTDLLTQDLVSRLPDIQIITVEPSAELRAAYAKREDNVAVPKAEKWERWLNSFEPVQRPPLQATESIIYTSGTTGYPKGVKREAPLPEAVAKLDDMRKALFGLDPSARALIAAPLYHTAPNQFALRAIRTGELLVLAPRFDPIQFLRSIEEHRITTVYAVATMFSRLLSLSEEQRASFDLSSLRFVLHAGSPCAPDLKQRMIDWIGPILSEYYGSTEHGPITFSTSSDWLSRPGTVGRAVEGVAISIVDEAGKDLAPKEIGEIYAANKYYSDFTYLNRPEARSELQRGNLIATGDVGYLDEEGFLYICDRKRDMVISGGVNIYPAEIEAVLLSLPGVSDSVVFGIPDEEFGEALGAMIELNGSTKLTVDDIRRELNGRLPGYKRPKHIEIRSDLPREESGKIKKRLVRESFWLDSSRRI